MQRKVAGMNYRKAVFDDVEQIYHLVYKYADEGLMLARSRNTLYETLRDMIVAEQDGKIVGVGGLHLIWDKLGEIRTMAVSPEFKKQGIGKKIVNELVIEGKNLGVETLFTLTYQPIFFNKLGFVEITKDQLPHKVWKECIECPKFPNCDEIAMMRKI